MLVLLVDLRLYLRRDVTEICQCRGLGSGEIEIGSRLVECQDQSPDFRARKLTVTCNIKIKIK
ncbi:hypothetical protein E2C01_023935 [Portunus trituberculatus]|uniref:Uncharacterized protein n=1 Tax=Portunus trituberculatus TaxID=210409 RepID=A0A5B7EBA8_PORTR|nr:hypothetical protein [Portunus trituberculatus]